MIWSWVLGLLLYLGIACLWIRWKLWVLFSWPLYIILDNEEPGYRSSRHFTMLAQRALDDRVVVPFSLAWGLHVALGILAWVTVASMFIAIRLWMLTTKRSRAARETSKANAPA